MGRGGIPVLKVDDSMVGKEAYLQLGRAPYQGGGRKTPGEVFERSRTSGWWASKKSQGKLLESEDGTVSLWERGRSVDGGGATKKRCGCVDT